MSKRKESVGKWHGCYDDGWKGIIVPEAFAHPAKMAYGLTKRIFKHALSEGWIKPGDVVVDPFGGIGSTGIIGASLGLRVVCVELEEKFVELGRQNFERNRKAFEVQHFGHSYQPRIIQGDSRKLSEVIYALGIAGADVIVGGPPFQGSLDNIIPRTDDGKDNGAVATFKRTRKWPERRIKGMDYGTTPGQLGAMKPGNVDCVVGSPPFAEAQTGGGIAKKEYHNEAQRKGVFDLVGKRSYMPENQGQTEGNLKPGSVEETIENSQSKIVNQERPGKIDLICSSPPYERSIRDHGDQGRELAKKVSVGNPTEQSGYGSAKGNIGNDKGDTFWTAAKQIVSECHKILKPGGYAIWVVKAFIRKGVIVDFPGDWQRLCESQGFETIHTHHAMLVKETKHNGLFEEITEIKEKKSFFRRLAEKKGSPKIDYEVVLCTQK